MKQSSIKSLAQWVPSCTLILSGCGNPRISILLKLIQDKFLHHATKCINAKIMIVNVNKLNSFSKKSKTQIGMENEIQLFKRMTSKIKG